VEKFTEMGRHGPDKNKAFPDNRLQLFQIRPSLVRFRALKFFKLLPNMPMSWNL